MNSYHAIFMRTTQKKLADLRARSKAKFNRKGDREIRPAIPIEFSLEEFRTWVLSKTGGTEDGVGKCEYCSAPLAVTGFVPDHARALARGGRNSLDNFVFACQDDNDCKGEMSANWYRYLLRCLEQMPEPEAAIIRTRLRKSEKLASSVRNFRRMFAGKSKPKTDVFNQGEEINA
jgi:hypothetical protein